VHAVNWFSRYRVHHRVAEKFRVGRTFLLGDAGHIHSPAGGQGMNTGMGDAVNLAWKLAAVLQERAHPRLLDSYEPERIAFAHVLINTTDKAFKFLTSTSPIAGFFRRHVMPNFMAAAMKTTIGAHTFFKTVSQIAIQYRKSAISVGNAGKIRGGDRLPYIVDDNSDNHAPLASLDWQVHVYGKTRTTFARALAMRGIPVHAFAWSDAAEKAGFTRNGAYLVRPDGYIALAAPRQSAGLFARYLAELRIKPRGSAIATPAAQTRPSTALAAIAG